MLCYEKYSVRNTPGKGTRYNPRYTEATLIPKTFPLSGGGVADFKIATPVVKMIGAPTY